MRSSFDGAERQPDDEKAAENTLCIFKAFEDVWVLFLPVKTVCVLVDRGYYTFFHLSRQAQLAFALRAKKHMQKLINGGVPVIIHGIKLSPGDGNGNCSYNRRRRVGHDGGADGGARR